jgi:hypothetical protein
MSGCVCYHSASKGQENGKYWIYLFHDKIQDTWNYLLQNNVICIASSCVTPNFTPVTSVSVVPFMRHADVSWASLHNLGMWMRTLRVAACKVTQTSQFNASYTKATERSPMDLPLQISSICYARPSSVLRIFPSGRLTHLCIAMVVGDRLCCWRMLSAGGHMPESTTMCTVFAMVTAVKTSKPKVGLLLIRRSTKTI